MRIRFIATALASALIWAVCGGVPKAADPTVVVGVAPSTDMSLLILAVNKGFLQKQGLNARLQLFDSSPAALQGVVAGRADITENTEAPQLAARARGGQIVQVMTGYLSGKINGLVINSSVIKTPQDLIGKTIGVQKGSGANYHMAWFFARNKIPEDKVTVKYMDAPDQIPALARGDIQAFFSWEPFIDKAAQTVPNAKIYSRTADDGFFFAGNVVMREDMARNQKDVAVKVVKGLIACDDWITANPADAAKAVNDVLKAPTVAFAEQQIQLLQWPGNFKKSTVANEMKIAEWGAGMGLFPAKDAKKLVDELIDPAIIKEAAPSRTDL